MDNNISLLEREEMPAGLPEKFRLGRTLHDTRIAPFTEDSVVAYRHAVNRKKYQLFKHTFDSAEGIMTPIAMHGGWFLNMAIFYFLGALLAHELALSVKSSFILKMIGCSIPFTAMLTLSFGYQHFCRGQGYFGYNSPPISKGVTFTINIIGAIAFGSLAGPAIFFGPSDKVWKKTELEDYVGTIPPSVLETMSKIKEHCPQVRFHVEKISPKSSSLLMAQVAGEDDYVEVW